MKLSHAQKKLFIFLFQISILLCTALYFLLISTEETPQIELISTEEQATFCSFEDRSKCTTGLGDVVIARWFYLDSRLTAGYNVGLTYGDHHANIDASPTRSAA